MQAATARIVLITGANKGIGFEIARQLGRNGAEALIGARSVALGEAAVDELKAQGISARFLRLEVRDPDTILAAASQIEADYGRLDVLVNNAGVSDRADGPPSRTSVDAVRRIFETNVFGALAVAQTMLPLLKKSASGRIVNVSSGLGSLSRNSDPAWEFAAVKLCGYNASKAALNMLTVQLAAELKDSGVKVNSVDPGHPGLTATDLNAHRRCQTVAEGAAAAIRFALLPDDGPSGGFFSASGPEPW